LRRLAAGIGAIAWLFLPLLLLLTGTTALLTILFASLIPLITGAVWLGLGQLERRFYEGRKIPPRNLPEKGDK
jgi:hypothetical protein